MFGLLITFYVLIRGFDIFVA